MTVFWKTSISRVKRDEILVRGYPIEDLIQRRSFGDIVYLLLSGELPEGGEGRLVEAMLVSCCEHSLAAPSVAAVRFVASSGVPLQTAVASGVCAIGDVHGGAIEPCARILKAGVETAQPAQKIFEELRAKGQRLPGYGHRVHKKDPRVSALFNKAKELGLTGPHTNLARELEKAAQTILDRPLAMNVDGIIAALMCDLGLPPELGKAFFIIGRTPGFVAHAHEQQTQEKPFKAPSPEEIHYKGPGKREVPHPDITEKKLPL